MPTTPGGINYPASSDSIDIPGDFETLALDVEAFIAANAVTTTGTFTLTNKTIGSTGLFFEGATDNAFETLLTVVDPTADRTVTIPDVTGTVCILDATQTLSNKTLASPTFTGQVTGLELAFSQSIVFEGTTDDAFETTLTAGDPTADRTITLPDATGTLALSSSVDATVSTVNGLEIAVIMAAF
jgi:hypothetical protein